MTRGGLLTALGLGLVLPGAAAACMPIAPMTLTFMGGTTVTALGGSWSTLPWIPSLLAQAVTIGFKSAVFARQPLPDSLARAGGTAFFAMFLANLVSAGLGLLGMGLVIEPNMHLGLVVFLLPVAYSVTLRLAEPYGRGGLVLGTGGALALVAMFYASIFLLFESQGILAGRSSLGMGAYWGMKWLSATLALGLGIAFTTAIEASVVLHYWTGEDLGERRRVAEATLRANLVTFGVLCALGALAVLPARLGSPSGLI